jgi:hypothetical protein
LAFLTKSNSLFKAMRTCNPLQSIAIQLCPTFQESDSTRVAIEYVARHWQPQRRGHVENVALYFETALGTALVQTPQVSRSSVLSSERAMLGWRSTQSQRNCFCIEVRLCGQPGTTRSRETSLIWQYELRRCLMERTLIPVNS